MPEKVGASESLDALSTNDSSKPVQPKINTALEEQSRDAYHKLFVTAYFLAVDGELISCFETMVKVQKVNGLKL